MFINIVQKVRVMAADEGWFSKIIEWLSEFFRFGKDSRQRDEEREAWQAKQIAKESAGEERDETIETTIIKAIIKELERVEEIVSKEESPVEFKMGQREVTIVQALEALIKHLKDLIDTDEPVTEEKIELKTIEYQWTVVRHGLAGHELHDDVKTISSLFTRLNAKINHEAALSWQKIQHVKALWTEMQESEGGKKGKKQQAPENVEMPAAA
mgnify:CR=1 FL=1